jgi:hypothetical protein
MVLKEIFKFTKVDSSVSINVNPPYNGEDFVFNQVVSMFTEKVAEVFNIQKPFAKTVYGSKCRLNCVIWLFLKILH